MQHIQIKVIREPDDDGLYEYRISLSNGNALATLDFWGYAIEFREFAQRLVNFPKHHKETATYELGEEQSAGKMRWAYYMLLKVFCLDPSGQAAIKVIVDNHASIPDYQRSEFYITTEPAALNKLGTQLSSWSPLLEKEFSFKFEIS